MIFSGAYILRLLLGVSWDSIHGEGEWSLRFRPGWPLQPVMGSAVWNVTLSILALLLVVYVYRSESISKWRSIFLGVIRAYLFAFLLLLLNRPVLTFTQSKNEPSVLAIMVDDSASMRVPDMGARNDSRLFAVQSLLTQANGRLLSKLSARHNLRFYRFDQNAFPIARTQSATTDAGRPVDVNSATAALNALKPDATSTQVLPSILRVADDLQNQHVAGIVMLSDGRSTPARNIEGDLEKLKDFGMKVYPIAVGSDREPKNIQVQSLQSEDVAFNGDVVNVKAMVSATGYEPNHAVELILKDKNTGAVLTGRDGKPLKVAITLADNQPRQVELQWQTAGVGRKEISLEAIKQPGELDEADNVKSAVVSVLDAKIAVLYVDGYPRWDYRYLKNSLLRDKSISLSCLLASADFEFLQDGNKPLPSAAKGIAGHFPDTIEQLMDYDVVVIGDVDPHYFSENQLHLLNEFVNRGGGFMMVAGRRWAPQEYRNTPIESLLPVSLAKVEVSDPDVAISKGFRPVVTKAGEAAGMFRFFTGVQENSDFISSKIPELFWYCQGITAKPGVGEVLAEHSSDLGPDGHKAPILVAGHFGGRTLFSAVDDSWRWRFYNDQHVFDSYWTQQLRYLARNHKINQRRIAISSDRPYYELGEQVTLTLQVIDPGLVRQLPSQIRVQVTDADRTLVRSELLVRQDQSGENYKASFPADKVGNYTVRLPPLASGIDVIQSSFEVAVPQLELVDPRVDRIQLSRLASETMGKPIEWAEAEKELDKIPSAEKAIPLVTEQPLLNTPVTLIMFMLLVSTEWVVRKVYGMV